MKVAFISSEVAPFSKTGGLADVSGALPAALAKLGHEVIVITPLYASIDRKARGVRLFAGRGEIPGMGGTEVWEATLPAGDGNNSSKNRTGRRRSQAIRVLFISAAAFDRPGLYQDNAKDYPDNDVRFSFFSRAALALLKHISFPPDVLHVNDWQTALIPVYLKTHHLADEFFARTGTLLTIHNLAYQGVFHSHRWRELGLPDNLFRVDSLEFYGQINFLKGGIAFSDVLTTVSSRYAQEICTPGGGGLHGVIQSKKNSLFGILNGIDYDAWDPSKPDGLFPPYSVENPEAKAGAKKILQEYSGLPVLPAAPLYGCVSRLDPQKGCDILLRSLFRLMPRAPMQFVLLGTGGHDLEAAFSNLARAFPGKISLNLKFDSKLAKLIYAGSDFFLMPSKYEPCGLGQMIAMRYGTIPIVRLTGGLADTVRPFHEKNEEANGFGFTGYTAEALIQSILKSIDIFKDIKRLSILRRNAMMVRFTWENAAKAYVDLYARSIHIRQKGGDGTMAVTMHDKPAATSLIYEIGAGAGKVYQYLSKKSEGDTPAQIAKNIGLESTMSAMAIGWLARENNLVVEKLGNKKFQVRLIQR